MKTPNLGLSLLYSNQANKEVLVNENLNLLDHLVSPVIKSKKIPINGEPLFYGDIFIITEDNELPNTKKNDLVIYLDDWVNIPAKEGRLIWDEEAKELIIYYNNSWLVVWKLDNAQLKK